MPDNTIQSDCIIVGAGLVGTTLSVALSSKGLNVTLVEREKNDLDIEKDARSLVLTSGTVTILKNIGAWEVISSLCTPIKEVRISEQDAFSRITLKASESGLDVLGYSCPAHKLLKNLREKSFSSRSLTFLDGAEFRSMQATNSGIRAQIQSTSGPLTIEGKLLVGADGANSEVRKAAGIAVATTPYSEVAWVCKVSVSNPSIGTAFERFTKFGVLAFIPVGGNEYISVYCLSESESGSIKDLNSDAYANLLQKNLGVGLGDIYAIGPRYSYPLMSQKAQCLSAERTLLLGNAANVVHPNAAQGLNLGIRDIANLTSLVDRNATDIGDKQVIARYTELRYKDHKVMHAFTDSLGGVFLSKMSVLISARRLAMFIVSRSVGLRRRIVASSTGLDGRFVKDRNYASDV